MPRRARPISAGVKELRGRIERWRTTREHRSAMPPDLWAAAVRLAQAQGAYAVARGLHVSFEGLKRRMAESSAGSSVVAARSGAFVEMSGAELLGGTGVPGTVVELSDAAGTRLAVHLAPEATVDVAGLVSAFRQRRA